MTDKQLTPEEQEAVGTIAKKLCELDGGVWDNLTKAGVSLYLREAKELLALKGRCKACTWKEGYFIDKDGDICPVCHGTGEGEKLLLVRAADQTLPDLNFPTISGNKSLETAFASFAKSVGNNMIKGDETGYWVKVNP